MTDDELERLLGAAFDARARDQVGSEQAPPPPRFANAVAASASDDDVLTSATSARMPRSFGARALPWLTAAAVVVIVAAVLTIIGHNSKQIPTANPTPLPGTSQIDRATLRGQGAPVHIKLLNADQSVVGVGMPVVAYFSKRITDARALQDVTTVTVNGTPVVADWYFERSAIQPGYPLEAHLRMHHFWPADSKIHVGIATQGLTAGRGMRFDDSLTLGFRTGSSHVLRVNNLTHRLTVMNADGTPGPSFPVSLGAKATPTSRGIKVIMQKGGKVCISRPTFRDCGIKDTQQLTYSGEYLLAAPWNAQHIKHRINSSNGCTDLLTKDARRLYSMLRVGDVVEYPNASGPLMQMSEGFGDWNVPWSLWRTGGIVPTR